MRVLLADDHRLIIEGVRRALEEYVIGGIETTIPLHQRLVEDPDFRAGLYDIHWLERFLRPT